MEELFEKEQRKNEKLEQQMNLERREADYNKQMAERELALVQLVEKTRLKTRLRRQKR